MNTTEQRIATEMLNRIEKAASEGRSIDIIDTYQAFLVTVQTRLQIEAQEIENRKQA